VCWGVVFALFAILVNSLRDGGEGYQTFKNLPPASSLNPHLPRSSPSPGLHSASNTYPLFFIFSLAGVAAALAFSRESELVLVLLPLLCPIFLTRDQNPVPSIHISRLNPTETCSSQSMTGSTNRWYPAVIISTWILSTSSSALLGEDILATFH